MDLRVALVSPLGFLVGLSLGALGGGGSIIAVPMLVFLASQTPAAATTTSLVVVGVASLIGAFGHWRSGRVRVSAGLLFGAVGIPGSLAGSALSRNLDGDVLLLGFALLVLVAAWRMVVGCPSCTRAAERRAIAAPPAGGGAVATATPPRISRRAQAAAIVAAGTAVGFLTGLFGVGGGFLIVPALALVLRFPMPQAVGTSLLVIAVNAAVALAARAGTSTVEWGTTLLFTVAATGGVVVGTRLADRLEAGSMQRAFAVLLVAVALYTGVNAVIGLG